MFSKPISIKNLSFSITTKICFSNFNTRINYGDRIALIGDNGSGKSTLLAIINGTAESSYGSIDIPENITIGYVPQIITLDDFLSGGERFNKALTQALATDPDVLLLDEPTNHLDEHNRTQLFKLLQKFKGTLIIASHDVELLRSCATTLWHIDQETITISNLSYDQYQQQRKLAHHALQEELALLNKQKKDTHTSLMREQERAKKSAQRGKKNKQQAKWAPVIAGAKQRQAETTTGKNKNSIASTRATIVEQLALLHLHEQIIPTFNLTHTKQHKNKSILTINNGSVGYTKSMVTEINLIVINRDRIVIKGSNGSGKTTILKAILQDPRVITSGNWLVPKAQNIGYLDQHYTILNPAQTPLSLMQEATNMPHAAVRKHLNDFLFRSNEAVTTPIHSLSGGEKARLSLAHIAAQVPQLLILDEVTNNLDLTTREHIIEVLRHYPGAMIIISHDHDFLQRIGITKTYHINQGKLTEKL